MVSLSGIIFTTGIITVEYPTLFQFLSIPVKSSQNSTCIISTTHHYAWVYAVEIGNAGQKTVAAITTTVSPTHQVSSYGHIINCLHRFSCQSVKNCQIFRSGQDTSLFIPIVSLRIPNHFSCSIHRSVRGNSSFLRLESRQLSGLKPSSASVLRMPSLAFRKRTASSSSPSLMARSSAASSA